jgi:hypothetical protein
LLAHRPTFWLLLVVAVVGTMQVAAVVLVVIGLLPVRLAVGLLPKVN